MSVYVLNPLSDPRWDDLVSRHPHTSIFHERGWLEALARTYGYEPLVLTSASPNQPLEDGIVLCRVKSWLTGTRLVSLPFADHCEPLLDDFAALPQFEQWLRNECEAKRCKYVELRPLSVKEEVHTGLPEGASFWFHTLDLSPDAAQILKGFHKDSVQRRIKRAEKAGLTYEFGGSQKLIDEFYSLLLKTRRRHQLFPQPRSWFDNLFACLGDKAQIRVARNGGTPVAAMLTLRHKSSMVYKYGCSDENFHNLGGMPMLFWRLVEEGKATGATELDFGRSEMDNEGLVTFKDRFGTAKKQLTYFRYPESQKQAAPSGWAVRAARQVFAVLPDMVSPVAGRILYRHIG